MATVTNSIQGLNETIGLLKQILNVVGKTDNKKGGDDKSIQMKDLSSVAILSEIDKKGSENIKNVIIAIAPLDKMSNKIGEKAKGIVEAIKTLSAKDIVNGLKQYENISPKIIRNVFGVIQSIFIGINDISKKVKTKDIKEFANTMKVLTETLKTTTITLYLIASFVLVAALVGVVAFFAWKSILLGFATIVVTVGLIVGLTFLMNKAAKIVDENIRSIAMVIIGLYAISGLVVVSALVGLLAIVAWKQILIGFTTIVGVVVGILMVLSAIKMVNNLIKLVSFKMSGGELNLFRHLLGGDMQMPKDVEGLLKVLIGISLLPLVSALVGIIAINHFGIIMIGFGIILTILTAVLHIMKSIGNLGKYNKNTMNTLLGVAGLMIALSVTVAILVGIAILIKEKGVSWTELIQVTSMMTMMMFGTNILLKTISKIKPSKKGIAILAGVAAILLSLTFVVSQLVKLSNEANEVGWGNVWQTVLQMTLIIGGISLLMIGVGLLCSNPIVLSAIAIGGAILLGVSGVTLLLSAAVKSIIEAGKEAQEIGIDKIPEISAKMAKALTSFLTVIANELSFEVLAKSSLIGVLMKPIGNIINLCSQFMDMISAFSTEECLENELRPVYYDERKGEYKLGKKINVVNVGHSIGAAFGGFISALNENLKIFTENEVKKFKLLSKSGIVSIIDSCSSFVKMISGIVGSKEGTLSYYLTDSNGNFVQDSKGKYIEKSVNLVNVASTICNGFGTFITTLADKLAELSDREQRRLNNLTNQNIMPVIESTTKFIQMVSALGGGDITKDGKGNITSSILYVFKKDKNGNYIIKNGEYEKRPVDMLKMGQVVASGISGFITSLSNGIANANNLDNFTNNFEKITNSFEKITNSIFNVDDTKSKKLKEYTDAINKFAEAVGKVSESIDTLNSKKLDLKLDTLTDKFNMIIGVDTNINVNNNGDSNNSNNSKATTIYKDRTIKESIDTISISNAIIEGFKKINMLKVELNQNGGTSINLDGTLNIG